MIEFLTNLGLLFVYFLWAALLGVGGGIISVLPEISRIVIDTEHWMTTEELTTAFALGQAAPGPNMLFVALIGWHVAGFIGAAVATFAAIGPTALLALHVWRAKEKATLGPFGRAVQAGLAPLAGGLMSSTGLMLSRNVVVDWTQIAVIVATVVVMLKLKPNPMWLIGIGATAGLLGLL